MRSGQKRQRPGRLSKQARLTRNVEELKKSEASGAGGPVRLEEVYYTGPGGAEQAIFLPVLKALIIFRAIVCVPSPAQVHLITRDAKHGRTLFAGEPVPASEDIQQQRIKPREHGHVCAGPQGQGPAGEA